MSATTITPRDPATLARWEHTSLRRRMLYGLYGDDVRARIKEMVGSQRKNAWRTADMSGNIARASADSLSTLYDRGGRVFQGGTAETPPEFLADWNLSGWWSLQPMLQRDTWGLREMFNRFEVAPDGSIRFIPVFPDQVEAEGTLDRPDQPALWRHAHKRKPLQGGPREWVWEEFDIRDPEHPVYRLVDGGGVDVTGDYIDLKGQSDLAGERYRWHTDGGPIIPVGTYHAAISHKMFDPMAMIEVWEGTLTLAVLWSFWLHCVKDSSWPQRWTLNAKPIGGTNDENGEGMVTDPATVAQFEKDDSNDQRAGQPQIGQWGPGSDPKELQEAIAAYERRIVGLAGINPADVSRVSGDPRSGYALAITRSAQREAQRKFKPIFRRGDLDLVSKVARLWSTRTGTAVAEGDWQIEYEPIPKSPEESKSDRDELRELIELGLMDRVSAMQRIRPDLTDDQAKAELLRIAQVNRQFATA